jgi:probable blue pigment (indigoidine) exporter
MLVVTAGWGGCFVAIRYGLADAPVLWFAALRALLAGGVLLAVGQATHRPFPPRAAWPGILLLAVVNVAVAFAAMFAGTAGVASGVAAVLANAQPLLIVLPAWLIFHERLHARTMVGLGIGFAGLIVAATPAGGGGGGALLSLGAAAAITTGTLIARRLRHVDVVMLAGWQFLIGGGVLAGWAAIVEGAPAVSFTPRFIASLTFLALIGTAATYLIWFSELQRAPLVTLSAWTMLTPVFGVAFGWLLLGDTLSAPQATGVLLVLTALPVILLPGWHRRLARPGPGYGIARSTSAADAPPVTALGGYETATSAANKSRAAARHLSNRERSP